MHSHKINFKADLFSRYCWYLLCKVIENFLHRAPLRIFVNFLKKIFSDSMNEWFFSRNVLLMCRVIYFIYISYLNLLRRAALRQKPFFKGPSDKNLIYNIQ